MNIFASIGIGSEDFGTGLPLEYRYDLCHKVIQILFEIGNDNGLIKNSKDLVKY